MQTIEIYTPNQDDDNGTSLGLNHESILYDPEVLVEPVRIIRNVDRLSGFEEGNPQPFVEWRAGQSSRSRVFAPSAGLAG